MRLIPFAVVGSLAFGLAACTSTDDGRGSGLSESFSLDNYRRASTNGTQRRPDVNRLYTQPSMPTIVNRGN